VRLTLTASGPVDVDVAWSRYLRPALWPDWAPQIRRVVYEPDELEAGTTGSVVGPCGVTVTFEITAVDRPARLWSWRVAGPLRTELDLHHSVSSTAGLTVTTLVIDGPAVTAATYAPVAQFALHRLVNS
jgi:hypothetical protein